jgi:hypothetical protein
MAAAANFTKIIEKDPSGRVISGLNVLKQQSWSSNIQQTIAGDLCFSTPEAKNVYHSGNRLAQG